MPPRIELERATAKPGPLVVQTPPGAGVVVWIFFAVVVTSGALAAAVLWLLG